MYHLVGDFIYAIVFLNNYILLTLINCYYGFFFRYINIKRKKNHSHITMYVHFHNLRLKVIINVIRCCFVFKGQSFIIINRLFFFPLHGCAFRTVHNSSFSGSLGDPTVIVLQAPCFMFSIFRLSGIFFYVWKRIWKKKRKYINTLKTKQKNYWDSLCTPLLSHIHIIGVLTLLLT